MTVDCCCSSDTFVRTCQTSVWCVRIILCCYFARATSRDRFNNRTGFFRGKKIIIINQCEQIDDG